MTNTIHETSPSAPVRDRDAIYLAGRWQKPVGTEQITAVNPATGAPIATLAAAGTADTDRAVEAAREALDSGVWSRRDLFERAATLVAIAIADATEARTESLVSTLIADLGLPCSFAGFVCQTTVQIWRDVAAMADGLNIDEVRTGAGYKTVIRREPVSVVAAIVPFNAPTALAAAKIAPALLAGCSVVVKAGPSTPLASYVMAEVFDEVGCRRGSSRSCPWDAKSVLTSSPIPGSTS